MVETMVGMMVASLADLKVVLSAAWMADLMVSMMVGLLVEMKVACLVESRA